MEYDKIWNLRDAFDQKTKGVLDALGFGTYYQDFLPYSQYARSTLRQDLGSNYDRYIQSGQSLREGGWEAWFSLIKPQNTVFGQIIMAGNARKAFQIAEREAKEQETDVSGGYRNETATTKTDVDACKENCSIFNQDGYDCSIQCGGPITSNVDQQCYQACMDQQVAACELDCEGKPGYSVEEQLVNWGEDIHNLMGKVPLLDLDRLVDVKEITQLIGVFFSAVLNKAMSVGWGFATSVLKSGDQQQRTRIEEKERYAYSSSFKRQQTSEDRKDVRASTFANIQKSVKDLSRSIISCTQDEMMI